MKQFIALISLMLCNPLWAESTEPTLYQIELIVFQHPVSNNTQAENWPTHPLIPDLSKARTLTPYQSHHSMIPYELLPKKRLLLNREQQALVRRSNSTILFHNAWLQPMDKKQSIHLYAAPFPINESESTLPPYSPSLPWLLDGTVSLSKTNYFNLSTDLLFNINVNQHTKHFLLKQKRRLRANETHYIDHPLIGILIKIKPIEGEKAKA